MGLPKIWKEGRRKRGILHIGWENLVMANEPSLSWQESRATYVRSDEIDGSHRLTTGDRPTLQELLSALAWNFDENWPLSQKFRVFDFSFFLPPEAFSFCAPTAFRLQKKDLESCNFTRRGCKLSLLKSRFRKPGFLFPPLLAAKPTDFKAEIGPFNPSSQVCWLVFPPNRRRRWLNPSRKEFSLLQCFTFNARPTFDWQLT